MTTDCTKTLTAIYIRVLWCQHGSRLDRSSFWLGRAAGSWNKVMFLYMGIDHSWLVASLVLTLSTASQNCKRSFWVVCCSLGLQIHHNLFATISTFVALKVLTITYRHGKFQENRLNFVMPKTKRSMHHAQWKETICCNDRWTLA